MTFDWTVNKPMEGKQQNEGSAKNVPSVAQEAVLVQSGKLPVEPVVVKGETLPSTPRKMEKIFQ